MVRRVLLTMGFMLLALAVFAQTSTTDKLSLYYRQFLGFSDHNGLNNDDSAAYYRNLFREQIIIGVKENAKATLDVLAALARKENGLNFQATHDRQLYSVCWDDQTGGTMRNFEGLYIYHDGSAYVTESIHAPKEDFSAEANVYALYQVNTVKGKVIYLQFEYIQASSALFAYTVRTLSIDQGRLNRAAKYLKTRSGMNNSITYDLDWSAKVNRKSYDERIDQALTYDSRLKQFSFPLIREDETISTKRIRYRFNGSYFELAR